MVGTISVVFSLHTLLTGGYVTYLAASLGRYAGQRMHAEQCPEQAAVDGASLEAMLGADERMTTAAAHATLLLYLGYAEIYLYHSWRLFL